MLLGGIFQGKFMKAERQVGLITDIIRFFFSSQRIEPGSRFQLAVQVGIMAKVLDRNGVIFGIFYGLLKGFCGFFIHISTKRGG